MAWPRVGTTAGVGLGVLASLAPGLLPRTASAQAVLTSLLVMLALAGVGLTRVVLRRLRIETSRWARFRKPMLGVTAILVVAAMLRAGYWQNQLRDVMGVARIGAGYWLHWGVGTMLIVGAVAAGWSGLRWAARRLGRARAVAGLVVLGVATQLVVVPGIVDWRQAAYAAADARFDPAVVQPVSPTRSGSPESAISWPALGAQGRRFVAGDPGQGVRVYVGLHSAPDLDSRVELAIRELERSGGFEKRNLVVTVPTGSGWIDGEAAAGIDQRFGGDVALIGLQYSAAPSWVTFLFGRTAAQESARALFTAIEERVAHMPDPPRLFVYGQSLGALGGSSIFANDAAQDRRTCGVLWAGPPAGQVHRAGATVLANSSDPVVHWSPSLLWKPPDLAGTRPDAPMPQWIPGVSFVQTAVDLLGALDAPAGHGHRYGADQGTAIPDC
ncbi:alpha/beta-hydrolase family protein [Nocardia sp. NPDC127526]|uniref:alpha/beta-hydrolase family protein n=1 Tax=Nocardia sp. NPDC127526 TaxID=3345393 RepID=UPI0036417887